MSGLQCPKLLWWRAREPDAPELVPSANFQAVSAQGVLVGVQAREHLPGGVQIEGHPAPLERRLAATRKALDQGRTLIYEASFQADGVFAAVDILEREDDGWVVVEVKSTTDVKAQHIEDLALQAHVVEEAGLEVARCEVMHLDRRCRHPDLSNLFKRVDVTQRVRTRQQWIPEQLEAQHLVLAGPCPEQRTGAHCSRPYRCPFWDRCWPPRAKDDQNLRRLWQVSRRRVRELREQGYRRISDLPLDADLPAPTRRQVRALKENRLVVEPGLGEALRALDRPLAWLDFEAIAPAIPVWTGCRPYDQMPVQFSCHVENQAGDVSHHHWLAPGSEDPRLPLAQHLVEACATARTVLAWNAPFELTQIRRLQEACPDQAGPLEALAEKLVDLLPLVRDHVYHPGFGGSFSLKPVVASLLPDLAYTDLEVAEGFTAAVRLSGLLLEGLPTDPGKRQQLRQQLETYCSRDTFALMQLTHHLANLG